MLENTVTLFLLISVYCQLAGFQSKKGWFIFQLIGSGFIFLGFLSKGLVSLFTLAFPTIVFLVYPEKRKRAIWSLMIIAAGLIVFYISFIQLHPPANDFF